MPAPAPPTRSDRIFVTVNRVLSLLVLLGLLAGAAVIAYLFWSNGPDERPGVVKVEDQTMETGKAVALSFQEAEQINMADTEMIRLTIDAGDGKYSGRNFQTRNVLFVSTMDKPARWLFKDHKNVVSVVEQLQESAQSRKDLPTLALYVEFSAHQPGSNVKHKDSQLAVGFSRPDGSGFTPVLKDVARVLSHRVVDGRRVSVLFQRDTAIWQASISLADFTVVSERQIEKLPSAI
ncbi:hypothetical protein GJV26_12290 [Massilia dura]|uniref:Uncharacterized protein n=1 Tax=Pseudoduganella dura TaxID=321982 RepID=A0A6I3XFY0_9BURK|nr:hypothetical protein [Pseudoduganella dura]MUI13233.1 hypothetical protein [Pseudoduganella dura]GGX90777.1 hypothetical protein GCM10007386_22030 [Pseudoduganella dura]